MKTSKLLFITLISILTFNSCNNDDENDNSQSNSELIIGEWLYQSQTLNGNDLPFEDGCRGIDGVDYQVFREDNTFQIMDFDLNGGTECTFEEDESFSADWSINEENSTLSFQINDQIVDGELVSGSAITANILELNETDLIYMISIDYDEDGIIDELATTFKKR